MNNQTKKIDGATDPKALFHENVWLLIDNAELILNNPALFFAPTVDGEVPDGSKNYSNIGVWVEWWLKRPRKSRDSSDNPVIYFIGNPMTGTHSCQSVTREREIIVPCHLRGGWMGTMVSYNETNKQYIDTPIPENVMTLRQAIDFVKAHSTPEIRRKSAEHAELYSLRDEVKELQKQLRDAWEETTRLRDKFLKYYVQNNLQEIAEKLRQLAKSRAAYTHYQELTDPIRLHHKARLKKGEITQKEFQYLLNRIHKRQDKLQCEIHDCEQDLTLPLLYHFTIRTTIAEITTLHKLLYNR